MKTLLTTTLLAAGLSLSVNANAASLTHNGYTLDTETNIVTGGGLQWLQWDVTDGMSINQALGTFSGWTLASNIQMTGLLTAFSEGFTFTDSEIASQSTNISYQNALDFQALFGLTNSQYERWGRDYGNTSRRYTTQVMFGNDADGDGLYNTADVVARHSTYSDRNCNGWGSCTTTYRDYYSASLSISKPRDWSDADFANGVTGVALVRDMNVSAVPIPAAAFLFAPALLGFLGLRHKRRT
jgi:hypothetical protein